MTSSRRSAGSPVASSRSGIDTPDLAAVIPVYNEEPNLAELHDRVVRSLDSTGRPWELIYVDDGSVDGSLEALARRAAGDGRVRVIEFNRNYGLHAAVFAGL